MEACVYKKGGVLIFFAYTKYKFGILVRIPGNHYLCHEMYLHEFCLYFVLLEIEFDTPSKKPSGPLVQTLLIINGGIMPPGSNWVSIDNLHLCLSLGMGCIMFAPMMMLALQYLSLNGASV